MKYNLQAKNFTLSEHIRDYVEAKLIGTVERFMANVDPENIKLDIEIARTTDHHQKGEVWYAEVNLKSGDLAIRIETNAESPTAAIDLAQEELAREIRRKKEKKTSRMRRGARAVKDMLRGFSRQ